MAFPRVSVILLLTLFSTHDAVPNPNPPSTEDAAFQDSLIQQACLNTRNHQACAARLRLECHHNGQRDVGPLTILHGSIKSIINEALRAVDTVSGLAALTDNVREQTALEDCIELLDLSVDELGWSLAEMSRMASGAAGVHLEANLRSWLSAALSNQDTCVEGFEGTNGRLRHYVKGSVEEVTQLVSNVLVMYKRVRSIIPHYPPKNGTDGNGDIRFPPWFSAEDEELMRGDPKPMHVDSVVAADGSGRFRSITAAIDRAPSHSSRRYVIHVKKGVYTENIDMKKKKTNIMLVGDGMGKTIISGSRSFMDGWTTFRTATLSVSGQGFIARDITFRNTAGPQNHQAVALRVDSDRSAFYRCSIEGYQDTLYAHSLRQFYRECNIYGTIDFIFGNGQVVLQNCKIFTRRPLPYQKVTITAQGRKFADQNTGFSFDNCFVYATYPTYLGRPWKLYSRTVFMRSYLSAQVQPAGWLEWAGDFGVRTLFYGEYGNYGPGSKLGGRVRWPGYHIIRDAAVAGFFTARRFIDGGSWLPGTGVPYTEDLIK